MEKGSNTRSNEVRWPSKEQTEKVKRGAKSQKPATQLGRLLSGFQTLSKEGIRVVEDGQKVSYLCTPCGKWFQNDGTLNSHIEGKKHKKMLLQRGLPMSIPRETPVVAIPAIKNPKQLRQSNVTILPPFEESKSIHHQKGKNRDAKSVGQTIDADRNQIEDRSRECDPQELTTSGGTKRSKKQINKLNETAKKQKMASNVLQLSLTIPSTALNLSADKVKSDLHFALILFKYDKMVGRGGSLSESSTVPSPEASLAVDRVKKTSNLPSIALQSNAVTQRTSPLPKKGSKAVFTKSGSSKASHDPETFLGERNCFICRKQMKSGVEVAALFNLETGKVACSSRNRQGMFHVFHSSCLRDWTIFGHTKATNSAWLSKVIDHSTSVPAEDQIQPSDPAESPRVPSNEVGTPVHPTLPVNDCRALVLSDHTPSEDFWANEDLPHDSSDSNAKSLEPSIGGPFCPECQGTGIPMSLTSQLQKPRFRLAQVYEWMLELAQARRAWNAPKSRITPLVLPRTFVASELEFNQSVPPK